VPKLKVGVSEGDGGVLVSAAGEGVIAVGSEGRRGVQVGEPPPEISHGFGGFVGVDTGKLQLLTLIRSKTSTLTTNHNLIALSKMSMRGYFTPMNLHFHIKQSTSFPGKTFRYANSAGLLKVTHSGVSFCNTGFRDFVDITEV